MKKILLGLGIFVAMIKPLRADPIDGYVALMGGILNQSTASESGSRKIIRAEFARLASFISVDMRMGFGLGRTDYGGTFKVYKHWNFSSDSGTGVSAGLGGGASYVSRVDTPSTADGTIAADGQFRGYTDVFAAPFVRFIYDTKMGIGVIGEFEYDYVFGRYFTGQSLPRNDKNARQRMLFSVGVAVEI